MFTGIIEVTAQVLESADGKLVLERPVSFDDMKIGSSICVSGVCLSIVEFDDQSMRFDVVAETLSKTTLGELKVGDAVNLERALKVSDRFEGHIVQGHSEGVGVIESLAPSPNPPPWAGEGVRRGLRRAYYPGRVLGERARNMRKIPTKSERMMWQMLRRDQLGVYFRRQWPVNKFIMDFFCTEKLLGIEIDGPIHEEQKEYDAYRDDELLSLGIRILHFTSADVEENPDLVINEIKSALQSPLPPPTGEGTGKGAQNLLLTITLPPELSPFVIQKGSITIDGVSLTVASFSDNLCTVALIPHTLSNTTLGSLKTGDRVNIETDILGRYVLSSQLSL